MLFKKILLLCAIFSITSHALEDEKLSFEKRFLLALQKYHIGDNQRVLNGIVALVPSYFLCKNAFELLCSQAPAITGAGESTLDPMFSLVNGGAQQPSEPTPSGGIPAFINPATLFSASIFIYVLGLWLTNSPAKGVK